MSKHKFLFCLLLRDRLNTRIMLARKNFHVPSHDCVLCTGQVEETLVHLFFTCPFSQWCWRFLDISWNLTLSVQDMIQEGKGKLRLKSFKEIVVVAAWTIWNYRNKIIFDNGILSLAAWKEEFKE